MDYGKNERITKKIKAYGIVQGVGFRPLVYRVAQTLHLKGTVRNVGGYVEIIAQSTNETLMDFITEIKQNQINGIEIIKLEEEDIPYEEYKDFVIINSEVSEEISILVPDLPVCAQCQRELYEESDRRFKNPFISCMSCGPRYTIIEDLPYDRHNTTMLDFDMCTSCKEEYTSPISRRYHAQTISCNDCGPYLIFHDMMKSKKADLIKKVNFIKKDDLIKNKEYTIEQNEAESLDKIAIENAVSVLQKGGIIAVKGIGGYHFVCSPFIEETVQNLRTLKGREEKPFAIMFHSIDEIEQHCILSKEQRMLLETKARPIVLLYSKEDKMAPSTNKGSIYYGSFLPYTPLQLLLTGACGPLIMTSANISDKPIIKDDEDILAIHSQYLDGVLYNKRRIVRSVDDSVAKITDGKPQLIRRSRGYVPYPVFIQVPKEQTNMIFSAGGDLKAAYCLYQKGSAVVSQYFGDLEEISVMEEYQKSYTDLKKLMKIKPSLAVCDMHPNYHSSRFAKSLGLPILEVQHHHAHIASVMAEHDLQGTVIGIAFDGTGYGLDGCIWGGEFLICEGANFKRVAHIRYSSILGGDNSMKDAKKTATCYLLQASLDQYVMDERKELINTALKNKINTVMTSSIGRLFDAVASILNIAHENRYEGECAALLEKEAVLAIRNQIKPTQLSFAISEINEIIEINPSPLLEALCQLQDVESTSSLALGFHYAIADAAGEVCERIRNRYKSNTIALSGGVFQNTVLTEQTLKVLRQKSFEVFVNMALPPNDGAISLGQTYIGMMSSSSESDPAF